MYTAYVLTEKSRKKLAFLYPPQYEEFIGHHITHTFGVAPDADLPAEPTLVEVVGYFDTEDGLEGFLVEVDGTSERPSGGLFHITWSLDRSSGYKPVHSNNYVKNADKINPIKIDVDTALLR